MKTFPQNVVAWIRLLGLFEAYYKRSLLQDIDSLVEKVVKIDVQIDSRAKGQFARFAVQVNLANPLIFKIRITDRIHRVKYESLQSICFYCGRFGHLKDVCPHGHFEHELEETKAEVPNKMSMGSSMVAFKVQDRVKRKEYDDWMVVDHRQQRQQRQRDSASGSIQGNNLTGS